MCHGLPIIVSDHALAETEERLFPASRHRSKRIRKKLLKRYGGEFRKVPTAYRTFHGIIMHPTLYADLKRHTSEKPRLDESPLARPVGLIGGGSVAGVEKRPHWLDTYRSKIPIHAPSPGYTKTTSV